MRIRHFVRAATTVAAIALSGIPAAAAPSTCSVPPQLRVERPDPDGPPTRVDVGVYILDIPRLDERNGTFQIDMFTVLQWQDPRLGEAQLGYSLEGCRVLMADIWNPEIRIMNREVTNADGNWVEIDSSGGVRWAQRVSGTLSADFDLREFPLDLQYLPIKLVSFAHTVQEVELVSLPVSGRRDTLTLSGWSPSELEIVTRGETVPSGRRFARMDFMLPIKRIPSYYLWKIILPLSLIVAMAWAVFWLDPAQLNPQMGVSTASVFTLVAFLMSLGQLLPPESYLTRLDKFVLGCTLMVFLALGEAITTSRFAATGRHPLAIKIDRAARFLYPLLFALMAFVTLRM